MEDFGCPELDILMDWVFQLGWNECPEIFEGRYSDL